jgi:hypothetical protein
MLEELIARVSTADSEILENSPTSIWGARREENVSVSCAGSKQQREVKVEVKERPELTEKQRRSRLAVAAWQLGDRAAWRRC